MLCNVMLEYAMWCYVMFWYDMICCAMISHAMLCDTRLRYVMFYVTSCYTKTSVLCHDKPRDDMIIPRGIKVMKFGRDDA